MSPDLKQNGINYGEESDLTTVRRKRQVIAVIIASALFLFIITSFAIIFARAAIPPEQSGDIELDIPPSNFARFVDLDGTVRLKRWNEDVKNSDWMFINGANMKSIPLKEGDLLNVQGNESYVVFALDSKTRFLLQGHNASITFKELDKTGDIILQHDEGELQGNVDKSRGYRIKIIDPSGIEYSIIGTEFVRRATRRKSSISVASGSVTVNRTGMSKYVSSEIVSAGEALESIAGRMGRKKKAEKIIIDPVLKKTKEEIEKEQALSREEKEKAWETAITRIMHTWAEKGLTERGTTRNRLYTEPPEYTSETITLLMGLYVGRVWGKAAKIKMNDIPQIQFMRSRKFIYSPEPGNRTHEKILDRLFVRSGVKEAKLMLETKKRYKGRAKEDIRRFEGLLSREEAARLAAAARQKAEEELIAQIKEENTHVIFRITADRNATRAAVFQGTLKMHDTTAEDNYEHYSIPAGTAFAFWIHKPQFEIPTYHAQHLDIDDFLAYAGIVEQFWRLGAEIASLEFGAEENKKKRRRRGDIEAQRLYEFETLWDEEKRKGLDIEFIRAGLYALVNFNMDVTFEARRGLALPKRIYPCFMVFQRIEGDGTKPEHWNAILGGYRTFCAGQY
ncbi:MAG: hypothetical protein ACYS8W_11015 [Planctomycetota bacterium]|jgi:hypothetical protein